MKPHACGWCPYNPKSNHFREHHIGRHLPYKWCLLSIDAKSLEKNLGNPINLILPLICCGDLW